MIRRFAAPAIGGVAFALVFVVTQFVISGDASDGTPGAVLFQGLVLGVLNALVAVGVVLIYRMSRIINFAQGALGAVGGVFTYNFAVLNDWPFLLALFIGLVVSAAVGALVELAIVRRFFNAPRLVLTVLTIALIGVLNGGAQRIDFLPVFPPFQERTQEELAGTEPLVLPFQDFEFAVGDFPLSFGFEDLFAIIGGIAAIAALGLFLRFSRFGVAIRAVPDNPERAPMLGINVGTLSLIVWTIAGSLAGLGVILGGAVTGAGRGVGGGTEFLLIALGAAVLAQMTSLTGAAFAAVGLTILRQAVVFSYPDQSSAIVNAGLFLIVLIGLLLTRRRKERSEEAETSWEAAEEYRPIPQEMLGIGGLRMWRWSLIGVALIVIAVFPFAANTRLINQAGFVAIVAIAILSLVVLTGWAGQASLGQWAIVGIGAVIGGAFTARLDISFWLAILIVPLLVAGLSMLIGLPALRIRGLYLAVATFAFAFAIRGILFDETYFGWLLPEAVVRPKLFLLDFEDERSMYFLTLGALTLAIVLVMAMRRSRIGRIQIGVRENESNAQSFGVNVLRMRLAAFAISGFLCGFAGVLLAHHQRAVQGVDFEAFFSLRIFLLAVVGGVGSIAGVLLGAGLYALQQLFTGNELLAFLLGDLAILAFLYIAPGGLASMFFRSRDAILRIVAQRRQMVVPSLFADIDPATLAEKLIPLAEPLPNSGLSALPLGQRYRAASEIYGEGSWLRAKVKEESTEKGALGAAAESFGAGEATQGGMPSRG